jgi:hypothetical protein
MILVNRNRRIPTIQAPPNNQRNGYNTFTWYARSSWLPRYRELVVEIKRINGVAAAARISLIMPPVLNWTDVF